MTDNQQNNKAKTTCFCGEVVTYDGNLGAFYCKKCEISLAAGASFDIEVLLPPPSTKKGN